MALINCPKCGHTVSDRADKCPNCGISLQTPENIISQNGYQNQQVIVQSTYQQQPEYQENDYEQAKQSSYQPPCPKTWMVESILVTVFCCLPFGIIGIINASKVTSNYRMGRYDEADDASYKAEKYTKIAFGIGIVIGIINLIYKLSTH